MTGCVVGWPAGVRPDAAKAIHNVPVSAAVVSIAHLVIVIGRCPCRGTAVGGETAWSERPISSGGFGKACTHRHYIRRALEGDSAAGPHAGSRKPHKTIARLLLGRMRGDILDNLGDIAYSNVYTGVAACYSVSDSV